MKKLIFIFVLAVFSTSCSIDDDGPVYEQKLAKIVEADLPNTFLVGEVYKVDVVYLLPDACHSPLGLTAIRGAQFGEDYRKIYVTGVVTREQGSSTCSEPVEDLEVESSFTIRIDATEPFTFYLWKGVDNTGEAIYTVVEVPVQQSMPQ